MKNTVIFIVGPTSSGKSAVAAALAERVGGEVISCDSMQVYRDMDVLTRAPGEEMLARVRHHLVKVLAPEEEYSAARFAEESASLIECVLAEGKIPVVTGGTGLYMKSLVDGIFPSPPKDEELRKNLRELAVQKGNEYLYERLGEIDPETAAKLHPNDTKRIIRALEVYELTGRTICEKKRTTEGISSKYDCRIFGLEIPRGMLNRRIGLSVDRMFEKGLVEEVERLKERNLSLTAGKALGIKEISAYLDGRISMKEASEELKKNTRQYAKRQLTWFRGDERIIWIDATRDVAEIVNDIAGRI